MKHFIQQEWIDFVRGLAPEEQSQEMQRHLDSGCSSCRKLVETWKHVADCAQHEKAYEPPDVSVRVAKAQFALNPPEPAGARAHSRAELVFDSSAQPLAVGIRSAGSRARQLVFRKGNYSVDMRIELQGNRLLITGQVLDASRVNTGMGNVPVRLMVQKQQTTTGRFGEFQFEVEPREHLELLFVMDGERDLMISVPLSQAGSPPSPGVTIFFDDSKKI